MRYFTTDCPGRFSISNLCCGRGGSRGSLTLYTMHVQTQHLSADITYSRDFVHPHDIHSRDFVQDTITSVPNTFMRIFHATPGNPSRKIQDRVMPWSPLSHHSPGNPSRKIQDRVMPLSPLISLTTPQEILRARFVARYAVGVDNKSPDGRVRNSFQPGPAAGNHFGRDDSLHDHSSVRYASRKTFPVIHHHSGDSLHIATAGVNLTHCFYLLKVFLKDDVLWTFTLVSTTLYDVV